MVLYDCVVKSFGSRLWGELSLKEDRAMSNSVLMENDEKHKKLVINYDGQEWVLEGPRGKEFTGTGGK